MLLASGSASLVGLLRSAKSFAAGDPTLPAITVSASPITDPYYPGSGTLGTGEVSPLRLPPVLTNGNITGPVFKVGDFFWSTAKRYLTPSNAEIPPAPWLSLLQACSTPPKLPCALRQQFMD